MTHTGRKIRVGILFGGRSGEHEISLRSAQSLVEAIDRDKYDVSLVGIDRVGQWRRVDETTLRRLAAATQPLPATGGDEVVLPPAPRRGTEPALVQPAVPPSVLQVDVVFPVLHGTFGEDGTVQGLFELADVPYVGAGVLGSAVGMDKDVQKRLLRAAGIAVVPFVAASRAQWAREAAKLVAEAEAFGFPLFVKPANLGSSVGIAKVKSSRELDAAVAAAFEWDDKILVEKGVDAREIECAVLGNDEPLASVAGEILPHADFYSYDAKYLDGDGAGLEIPARLSATDAAAVRDLAVRVFRLLECAGMARVDFFLERSGGTLYVNEINTIPGFTSISMYPKLWEASGVPYASLIDRLLSLALERHALRSRLRRSYDPR